MALSLPTLLPRFVPNVAQALKLALAVCFVAGAFVLFAFAQHQYVVFVGAPAADVRHQSLWRRVAKREVFVDLLEAKVLVKDYRGRYNQYRPHSALGYQTLAEFAAAADLNDKVENAGKPEELESVLTLS